MSVVTPAIPKSVDPIRWSEHRFGLSVLRWTALRDTWFWITGGGTGYGQCMALALAAAGASVFITGRRPEKLDGCRSFITSHGIPEGRVHSLPADIRDEDSIGRAVEGIGRVAPHLDGVVNNAALPQRGSRRPMEEGQLSEWEDMMSTNVTAHWLVTRAAFPFMLRARRARAIFMSSEAGWHTTPGWGPYNTSKAALNTMAASMANELALNHPDADVQMNVLNPGEARTEMNQGSQESPFLIVPMALLLLSHPPEGPNGRFFHRDGRHLAFATTEPYPRPLVA